MTQESPLYQLIESRLDGTLPELIAKRRPAVSWVAIAAEIKALTDTTVSDETLRLWFADRVQVEFEVTVS